MLNACCILKKFLIQKVSSNDTVKFLMINNFALEILKGNYES
jgi:hypothetical protein